MWGFRRLAGVGLLAGSLAAVAVPVVGAVEPRAPWPLLGSDFRVSGSAEGVSETEPAVVWNGAAGEYLVTWTAYPRVAPPGDGIYGRRMAGDGTRLGAARRISSQWDWPGAEQRLASRVAGGSDGYLVVWWVSGSTCGGHCEGIPRQPAGVWARPVSTAGVPEGTPVLVSDPFWADPDWPPPTVAENPDADEYLVVWERPGPESDPPAGPDLLGRRVSAAGALVGEQAVVRRSASAPAVAWNATAGEYLVVSQGVYGRRFTTDGTPIGFRFRISGPHGGSLPAVLWNGAANEYLVLWVRGYGGWSVVGRRVAADGTPLGSMFRISGRRASKTFTDSAPAIAWSAASNRYLVVWSDTRHYLARGSDIYGRLVNADGTKVGDDFRVSGRRATAWESFPAVAWSDAVNGFLVVWTDGRNAPAVGGYDYDIYGRRVAE